MIARITDFSLGESSIKCSEGKDVWLNQQCTETDSPKLKMHVGQHKRINVHSTERLFKSDGWLGPDDRICLGMKVSI